MTFANWSRSNFKVLAAAVFAAMFTPLARWAVTLVTVLAGTAREVSYEYPEERIALG
jgi:hypothetical protein